MNSNGITTDLRVINCIVETGIEPDMKSDLILSRNIDNYVMMLYTHCNEQIPICDEKTFELLKCRLELEHQENKFKFYHRNNIPYVCYLKDEFLHVEATIVNDLIYELFEKPNTWIEINFRNSCLASFTEKENQILFARIFQRLRNEHSDIVHKFLPRIYEDNKYFICFDTTDNSPETCFDKSQK